MGDRCFSPESCYRFFGSDIFASDNNESSVKKPVGCSLRHTTRTAIFRFAVPGQTGQTLMFVDTSNSPQQLPTGFPDSLMRPMRRDGSLRILVFRTISGILIRAIGVGIQLIGRDIEGNLLDAVVQLVGIFDVLEAITRNGATAAAAPRTRI